MEKIANISSFEEIMNRSSQPVHNNIWDKTKKAGMTAAMMAALSGIGGTGQAAGVDPRVAPILQPVPAAMRQNVDGLRERVAKTARQSNILQKKREGGQTVTIRYNEVDPPFGADIVFGPHRSRIHGLYTKDFCQEAEQILDRIQNSGGCRKARLTGIYPGPSQVGYMISELRKRFPQIQFEQDFTDH